MSAGIAVILALAGGVLIVMGARGTYPDIWDVLAHPAKGKEPGGAGLAKEPGAPGGSEKAPTAKE